jgi:hypothetical protein
VVVRTQAVGEAEIHFGQRRRESEPGTCKDRLIFEHDPHAVIEGTIIAGLSVQAKMGFIYLRGEYRYLLEIMEKAVADAYAKGFLGKNIFGSGIDFDIVTQTGAGAYEVGEESALMESLEGKRGIPRIRPPFPLSWVSMADPPSSTTPRPSPPCRTSSAWAAPNTPNSAPNATAARDSSASAATSNALASTSCPWATT